MKAKVISRFIDKHTNKFYERDSFYEGEAERINELAKKGHVEIEVEGMELDNILVTAKSHADLDKIVKEIGLEDVPSKEDGATIDERKKSIEESFEKLADQEKVSE